MRFADRVMHLQAEGAYQVLDRARKLEAQGRDIVHLEIGEPETATALAIREAGIQAIRDGLTRYTSPAGLPELRAAIAEHHATRRGIRIDPAQVVVSPGAKPNLFLPTLALVEPGDHVLYPDPGFPTYAAMIRVAGGVPIPIRLDQQRGFSFDMQQFEEALSERTRLILINSPGNPTGGIIPLGDLERIAEHCRRLNCWVLSDEIYSRLVYDRAGAPSILDLDGMSEQTIVVDGFSKTYAMTGWRLGYGIMPYALAERVELLLTHAAGSTAHFTQIAGLAALQGAQDEVEAALEEYRNRRDMVVSGLREIHGIECEVPSGAFYAFPKIASFGITSETLANRILEEAGVALLPGSCFGQGGDGYLRISYACSRERLQEGLDRLQAFFLSLGD